MINFDEKTANSFENAVFECSSFSYKKMQELSYS